MRIVTDPPCWIFAIAVITSSIVLGMNRGGEDQNSTERISQVSREQDGAAPREREDPAPRGNGGVTRDGQSQGPTERGGQVSREQEGPAPRGREGPAPREHRDFGMRRGFLNAPPQREGRRGGRRGRAGQVSREQEGPAHREQEVPAPREQEGPPPREQGRRGPRVDAGPAPGAFRYRKVHAPLNPDLHTLFGLKNERGFYIECTPDIILLALGPWIVGWDRNGTIAPIHNFRAREIIYDERNERQYQAGIEYLRMFGVYGPVPADVQSDPTVQPFGLYTPRRTRHSNSSDSDSDSDSSVFSRSSSRSSSSSASSRSSSPGKK